MPNEKIAELEEKLAQMQKELEDLKSAEENARKEAQDPLVKFKAQLDEAQKNLLGVLKDITADRAKAVSTVITCSNFSGREFHSIATAGIRDMADLVEDGLSAALDVFTNPRRIAVLKLLASGPLTAAEISQNTGLVGGQLYHHLSCLENVKLIKKEQEKYGAQGEALNILFGLYAAVGGMEIAKR